MALYESYILIRPGLRDFMDLKLFRSCVGPVNLQDPCDVISPRILIYSTEKSRSSVLLPWTQER
jgi:hypothetical protein